MDFQCFICQFSCCFFCCLLRYACGNDTETGVFSADGYSMDVVFYQNPVCGLNLSGAVHLQKYRGLFLVQMGEDQPDRCRRPLKRGGTVFRFFFLRDLFREQIREKLFIQLSFIIPGNLIPGVQLHVVFGLYDSDHDREYDFNKTCVVIQKKQGEIQFVCQFQCFFWKIVKKSGFDSESGWQELP